MLSAYLIQLIQSNFYRYLGSCAALTMINENIQVIIFIRSNCPIIVFCRVLIHKCSFVY